MNNVKNNAEDAMNNVKNGTEDAMNNAQDSMQNAMDSVKQGAENVTKDDPNSGNISASDTDYIAQRTAGETDNNFFGFMNYNIWAWIIIGIVALAVVGVIWYYIARKNNYSDHE